MMSEGTRIASPPTSSGAQPASETVAPDETRNQDEVIWEYTVDSIENRKE